MIRDLVQVVPMCITFVAAVLLLRSSLELNVEKIVWGIQNTLQAIQNLSHQKADTFIGAILLFVAFIWQMINLTYPTLMGDFEGISIRSFLAALIFTGILLGLCWFASKYVGKKIYSRALASLGKN